MSRILTLQELYDEAIACKSSLENLAEAREHPIWVTYHWSISRYHQLWDDYQIDLDGDGKIHLMNDLDEIVSHTWKRNQGNIGVALSCCLDCSLTGSADNPILDLGTYPPTDAQIESAAQVGAVLAMALDLYGEYGERLKTHFYTHFEWAVIDNYYPFGPDPDSRYDGCNWRDGEEFGDGGNIIRGKINFYVQKFKQSGIPQEFGGD